MKKYYKPKKHNHKFNRRRALECKLVEKSKSNPGYLKYMVTIGEKDGTVHTQPAYGKDMQGALNRLLKKELTTKVLMGAPAIFFGTQNTPLHLVATFGTIIMIMVVSTLWYNYINKQ